MSKQRRFRRFLGSLPHDGLAKLSNSGLAQPLFRFRSLNRLLVLDALRVDGVVASLHIGDEEWILLVAGQREVVS